VVVAVVLLVALWPSAPARTLPPTRARQYTAFDACLLTGSQGLADPAVRPVWAGMQDASLATKAKVSYLAVAGPQTSGNAEPYANTLLQRRCSLVIGVGKSQVDAVAAAARSHPKSRFAVVGGDGGGNVTSVPTGTADAVRSAVATMIKGLAG
jgi:basic membrane lipoprotein Med (substrate-binding protein (PBP1-ABC) superfamily)